jgi:hypothetical protein
MGSIIGGLIGGVGSLLGGQSAKSNAMTGYNYLTGQRGQPGVTSIANNAVASNNAEAQLLGTAPVQAGTKNGFNNYLNSTGYQFQKDQGTSAITGSTAAKGILNSGSSAKALQTYGQNTAAGSFNNYLTQLNTQTGQGLTASGQIGQAGTQGGGPFAAKAISGGISGAFGSLAKIAPMALGL